MDFTELEKKLADKSLTIAVFGLGRIGLPTALVFTRGGYHVKGMDINEQTLVLLQQGHCFDDEPGLKEWLKAALDANLIGFTANAEEAVAAADVMITCVPTPLDAHYVPDYTAIKLSATGIGRKLRRGQIYIAESSVSPTTIERIIVPILEQESGLRLNDDFVVCSCPERADPGKIVGNFDTVARIVGGTCPEGSDFVARLYRTITKAPVVTVSSPGTANAVKLTENIFRDVNIALMNEFAVLYEKLGIDALEVIRGSATKYNFIAHYPGPGVGGPCLPANPYYIIEDATKVNYIPFLIRVAREINDRMPEHVRDMTIEALNEAELPVKNTPIVVMGISYKANVGDCQISPALPVIKFLQQLGGDVRVWDPYFAGRDFGDQGFRVGTSLEESLRGAKALVVCTDHQVFKEMTGEQLMALTGTPLVLVDARNIYTPSELPVGAIYCGVGRPLRRL